MRRLTRIGSFVFTLLVAASHPAWADDPPKKQTTYVRPEDMPAAEAARKKAVEGKNKIKAGDLRGGVQMLDEAVGELERTTGPDSDFSNVYRNLAVAIYKQLGDTAKVSAVEARADAARKKWSPPPTRYANQGTSNAAPKLAASLEALKNHDIARAAEILETAMPDLEKSDATSTQYLLFSGVLASLYDHSQQFAKGEALRKSVIAKMERSGDSQLLAGQYEQLATHYIMRSELEKARAAQQRCVEVTKKSAPTSPELVDRLLTLSGLQGQAGDSAGSDASLHDATRVVRTLNPIDPVRMVRVAHTLATSLDTSFKMAEGDQVAAGACDLARASGMPEAIDEAEPDCIRTALGKKDYAGADALSTKRLARMEKNHGTKSGIWASAAHELAQIRWVAGKKDDATALAGRAAEVEETVLTRLLSVSGESERRAQLQLTSAQSYDLLSMGGNGDGGGPAQVRLAFETILRRKGRSLDASTDAARVARLFERAEDKALVKRQFELRREIAALGLRGGSTLPGSDPAKDLPRLEAEHDEISNKLAAASPLYRAEARPVTIAQVQAALPDDGVLVEYSYYLLRDTTSPIFAPRDVRFVAFVLHKSGDPVAIDLGDAVAIGRSIGDFRKSLSSRGDVLPDAKRVYDLAFAPVEKALRSGDKRIIVSPDDDLNLVPFGALVDPRGQFLVQRYEIGYVTSGRELVRLAALDAKRATSSPPLVLGDPAFDGAGASGGASGGSRAGDLDGARFPPLPGTAAEIKAVAGELSTSAVAQGNATKSRLVGAASPTVLHVATHGFFLKKQREASARGTRALEFDDGNPVSAPPLRSENPLIRSGLALAGANQRTSADGLLSALEVSSMNLEGTRLVVLSACETGVGETEVGDGVYGLRRALVVAGAESQVMSLWKVDDEATRDLMIGFYKSLKKGTGRAAALRDVQLAMIGQKATQHPYFWAAFIPSGAWTPMRFEVDAPSPAAKDKPASSSSSSSHRYHAIPHVYLGANYMSTTNLRDQADRNGALLGIEIFESLISGKVNDGTGFAVHDGVDLQFLAGARTSGAVKYPDGNEEGAFALGLRGAYELALGGRSSSFSAFVGGRAEYSTFILGGVRAYGTTLPLIALVGVWAGDTFISLRGQYGKWIVDQETASAMLGLSFSSLTLRGGIEQLKMSTSVALDGDEGRASARNQVTTLGSVQIGLDF